MDARVSLIRLFVISATLSLGGCLISDKPLLDAKNGRAAPLASGYYEACEHDGDGGDPDCRNMDIRRGDAGLYEFRTEDEDDLTFVRFRRIGRGVWLAQLIGQEDEDYFYFLAESAGETFTLAMIVCGDIPGSVRAKYVARGEMEVDDDATVCEVNTLRAATASARAYRNATPTEKRSRIVYRKLAEAQE